MNQDLCLSRKKTANMAAILASPPEARAKAGARGNWFFEFFGWDLYPKKNDNCTLGRRVCFLVIYI